MDLSQKKLVKEEWEALEVPVSKKELEILKLIRDGYNDLNIRKKVVLSIIDFIKLKNTKEFIYYLYESYFKKKFDRIYEKKKIEKLKIKALKYKLKKADMIRIKNSDKKINKSEISEFILIKLLKKVLKKSSKQSYFYYTLIHLLKNKDQTINIHVQKNIAHILEQVYNQIKLKKFIQNAPSYIENNNYLDSFAEIKLYSHQQKLFVYSKKKHSKLIFYQAPTGTGKTISPIGLANNNKLIFVCAARHVGLQFAKTCISLEIPIAIAFDCNDPGDIKLHYYAAKDFVKNRRTGGIFRVDNSSGEKVQIIISDVKSYLSAMRYMLAFNEEEELIWYYDEPTISLDYEDHEFHSYISKNWKENLIPNIILSSATLPKFEQLEMLTTSFKKKFINSIFYSIDSFECGKTISIMDKNCYYVLPHFIYNTKEMIDKSADHLLSCKTLLRYLNLKEVVRFILYVNEEKFVGERYLIDTYFESIQEITSQKLKEYYLELLKQIKKTDYKQIFDIFQESRTQAYPSISKIMTSDAYTLTGGPTIYLTGDTDKISDLLIKSINFPKKLLDQLEEKINDNLKKKKEIFDIQKMIESNKKLTKERMTFLYESITKKINNLNNIHISKKYIPNSKIHKQVWNCPSEYDEMAFYPAIDESIIERIFYLKIDYKYQLLLMLGIGVFKKGISVKYDKIIKDLSEKQNLFLVIADSDYIYGTNYQFFHGYLSDDLDNITQEKIIQAFGRIGRSVKKYNYSIRLQSDKFIHKIFQKEEFSLEIKNMNKLFQ